MMVNVIRALLAAIEQGERFALASVIATEGSSPGKPGHKMLVFADGRQVGTVGGGQMEEDARAQALEMLASGKGGLLEFSFDSPSAGEGMICGGRATVVIEVHAPTARILVCGGGHVAQALARLFVTLGYIHFVVDERPEIAQERNFPVGTKLFCHAPVEWLRDADLNSFSHIIIMTNSHALDQSVLRRVLSDDFGGYVGLIGSGRKWAKIKAALAEGGIAPERLAAVHCPIGLPIGGSTPAEIAISIAAEIIQERHQESGTPA